MTDAFQDWNMTHEDTNPEPAPEPPAEPQGEAE